jgi:hypothetical protein
MTAHDTLTAAVLVREVEQHMRMLLDDPAPIEKAPGFFLAYWVELLQRVQGYLTPET